MPALRIAGYSRSPGLLDDAQAVREWFVGLAERMEVVLVNGPTIISFKDSGMPEAGLSAFAIIAESHLAWHSWPEKAYLMAEITSCKPFDARQARAYTVNYFHIEESSCFCVVDSEWGNLPVTMQ